MALRHILNADANGSKKKDRDYVAIISMSDYENLVRMKNLRLKKLAEDIGAESRDHGLTSEILEEILNSDS
jgi:hypothetical protein